MMCEDLIMQIFHYFILLCVQFYKIPSILKGNYSSVFWCFLGVFKVIAHDRY